MVFNLTFPLLEPYIYIIFRMITKIGIMSIIIGCVVIVLVEVGHLNNYMMEEQLLICIYFFQKGDCSTSKLLY